VVSDSEIEILSEPAQANLPFLAELPESPLALLDLEYDPTDYETVLQLSGVFGIQRAEPRVRRRVIKRLEQIYRLHYAGAPPESLDLLLCMAGQSPFGQGVPHEPCPNHHCPNHSLDRFDKEPRKKIPKLIISIVPDEEAEPELFDELGDINGGQLTFQVCDLCLSVVACNTCT
jgi:hypothetical protein